MDQLKLFVVVVFFDMFLIVIVFVSFGVVGVVLVVLVGKSNLNGQLYGLFYFNEDGIFYIIVIQDIYMGDCEIFFVLSQKMRVSVLIISLNSCLGSVWFLVGCCYF